MMDVKAIMKAFDRMSVVDVPAPEPVITKGILNQILTEQLGECHCFAQEKCTCIEDTEPAPQLGECENCGREVEFLNLVCNACYVTGIDTEPAPIDSVHKQAVEAFNNQIQQCKDVFDEGSFVLGWIKCAQRGGDK